MPLAKALAPPLVIASISLCCFAAELIPPSVEREPTHILRGYSIGRIKGGRLQFYGPKYRNPYGLAVYRTIADEEVVRIGWNEDFIIVEQHPLDQPSGTPYDPSLRRWYVVVLSTRQEYIYLSHEGFLRLSERLHIPDTIQMRDALEVYGE